MIVGIDGAMMDSLRVTLTEVEIDARPKRSGATDTAGICADHSRARGGPAENPY